MIVQEREIAYSNSANMNYTGQLNEGALNFNYRPKTDGEIQDIQFKKIKIQSAIYIKFLIK